MDWPLLILASGVWSLLWGALTDRIFLGTDMFTLLFTGRKLKIGLLRAVMRSILWIFLLSLGNYVLSSAVCGAYSFEKIGACIELNPKLEAFVGFSYIVALAHIILSLIEREVRL